MISSASYTPWSVDSKNFPKTGSVDQQILFFLQYAILAPSTFNSQPWKCKLLDSQKLEIYLDHSRITQTSDKKTRFVHISLGCFIANLQLAAQKFGFSCKFDFPAAKPKSHLSLKCVVFFSKTNQKKDQMNLFQEIPRRATNRSLSLDKAIPKTVLGILKKLMGSNQKLVIFDQAFKDQIVEISKLGDKNIWNDYEFRKEHVQWVRHNLTRAKDGMPAFGVGIGLIPSFFARPAILSPIFPIIQMLKNTKALQSSKLFIALCAREDLMEWIKLGVTFQKISLFLSSKGIAVSPMGQFIEDNEARNKLSKMSAKYTKLPPQMFFRIGYPKNPVAHSPRMSVGEILL